MVKTKLGPNSHCNRAHILCRHFLPKNDWSKQSKNSSSCCNIDWACFARALAMPIALALYRDLIRGQFHPEYCHLLHAGRERLKRQRRLLFWKTLTTVATIFTFWPPASDGTVHLCLSFTPVEDTKQDNKLLKCDCLVFIAAGVGDTGAVFPSRTSQEFRTSNWNAKIHGEKASMTKS